MSSLLFNDLDLSREVQKAITEMGFEEATPIQSKSIPSILEGKDVIGQAQTGTGKTCAFGIPIVEMINPTIPRIQALVLCPTRELAIQSAEEIKNVSKYKKGLKILPIYGGQPIERQISALKQHPQVIIGTPGRVMDHMRRNTLQFTDLKMLILDEADEMLNMGFREDIDTILQKVPAQKQTILFSATMPKEIMDLTTKYQKAPVLIKAVHQELTVPNIEQYYLEVRESTKLDTLSRLIDANNIKLSLVFCNTKSRVDELASHLQSRGYLAESLHGDMRQAQRDKVMTKFRRGAIDILIATDVAARGIDVDDIEAVFNYDLPNDEEYYVHRIGRTGRAGRTGKAFTFISGREIYKLKDIQRYTKSKILPKKAPSLIDVEDNKINKIMEDLKNTLKEGHLAKYVTTIEKFLETTDLQNEQDNDLTTLDIAAAFLKMATQPNNTSADTETSEDYDSSDSSDKSMSRLFINAGRDIKLQPKQLIQAITACTSIPEKRIGNINIYEKFTFVEIPAQFSAEFLNAMKHNKINGRKINVEKANSK
jgi:ATP-dependent RNA helicase DeaD